MSSRRRRQQPRVAGGHRRFDAAHPVRRPAAGGSRPVPVALGCPPHRRADLAPASSAPGPDEPPGVGPRLHLVRAHRTPDAARRQRAHLSRIFRVAAPDDLEGRARQRGLRLLQHRPARHRRHPPGLRRGRLRPPGSDLPPRAVRRVQGDPPAHAGRPARPVPQGPRGGQGVAHPRLRAGGLRGRRRHRHDHGRRRTARPGDHDRDRRSRHAPARHGSHPAHDDAIRRREHDPVRPGPDRRAVRSRPRPDDRLQGAQGRPDRQHPGRARGRREDGSQAHPRVRDARGAVRPHRRGQARQAARQAGRAPRRRVHGQGPVDDRARPAGRLRSRGGAARRLRPRDRHPAVPRVRVPLAHRAPAGDDRRIGRGRGGSAARGRDRRVGAGRTRRRGGATVRLGLGAPGPATVRGWRSPALARFRCRGEDRDARMATGPAGRRPPRRQRPHP